MKLYTSLVRLKQAMNGGALPPMTPLPPRALAVIDPKAVPGLGALSEDGDRGLLCPVVGCGKWFHNLGLHLHNSHADIGGAPRVKALLDIPASVPMLSAGSLEKWRRRGAHLVAHQNGHPRPTPRPSRADRARGSRSRGSVNARNLRDRCDAQLATRLLNIRQTIGRTPSSTDAAAVEGKWFVGAICRAYGTWNNALMTLGMRIRRVHAYTLDDVLDTLDGFRASHGRLPTEREAQRMTAPLLLSDGPIRRLLGGRKWKETMENATALLGPALAPAGTETVTQPPPGPGA